jgi:hypothetical protein
VALLGLLVAGGAWNARAAEYPPALRLKDQVPVPEEFDRVSRVGASAVRLIIRGHEAINFGIGPDGATDRSRWLVYDSAQKEINSVPAVADLAPSAREPALEDRWAGIDRWRRHFERAGREDLLGIEHLEEGFACRAVPGPKPDRPAELFVDRPGAGPVRLGPLATFDDRPLSQVCWLRMMPSGDVAVLAGDGKRTVLQVYENPMLDAIDAQWNALMNQAYRDEPTVLSKYLGSLYDLSEYADRAFDPYLPASDGRLYFGMMPHHSSESGPVFAFDPKENRVQLLGDIASMAGIDREDAVPYMMHSSLIELNGKVYLTGQDPHYGGWNFPCLPGEQPRRFLGSPVVEHDSATGESRSLGIPFPGDRGIFCLSGDPERNALYVRLGYDRHHYGPLEWHRLALGEDGTITGKPQRLPFPEQPAGIVLGAEGTIFGVVPDLKLQESLQQKRRARESTDDITPTCYLYRCDPELRRAQRVATVTGTWDVRWAPWQDGKPSAIGIGDDALYELDLKRGAIRRTVNRPSIMAIELGSYNLHDGKMFFMPRVQAEDRVAGRTMALYSVDLRSGETVYYGLIVDHQERRPKDLNRFAFLPDGRIFTSGTVYAKPGDRHYMRRYRDSEPYRLDCAAFVIERLPPGKPAKLAAED